MTTRRMIVMLALAALVFGGVFGMKAMMNKGMQEYLDNMPIPPATISASAAQPMTWDNRLEAIGSMIAVNGTDVTTEAGGIVTAIHFESGATVKRGDALVTLDAANEKAELDRLRSQAKLAQLNLERREKLFKLEAISRSDYDAAQAEAAAARAAVAAQEALLARKDIRAPFSGQLGIRRASVGQYLAPGTAIVSLQSVDPIEFDFSLPEQHLAAVQQGLPVEVRVDGYADERFEGTVVAVEPRVDERTRNFSLRARLPNPDRKLRSGQFGRVTLTLPGSREVLAVPRTAISYSSYGTSLFVIGKKAATQAPAQAQAPAPAGAGAAPPDLEVVQRFVRVGEARGDYVAVLEGLKPGEQVATSGLLKLRNQQPVVIDNSAAPKPELSPTPPES